MSFLKVAGNQRELESGYVKVNGVWREVSDIYAKDDGQYKEVFKDAFDEIDTISYPATIIRSSQITATWTAIEDAAYEISYLIDGEEIHRFYKTTNSITFTVTPLIGPDTFQLWVRPVEPDTRDKPGRWKKGPIRDITYPTLDVPDTFTYPTSFRRDDTIEIKWSPAYENVFFNIEAILTGPNNAEGRETIWDYVKPEGVVKYRVNRNLKYDKVRFRIKGHMVGYYDSDWLDGPTRTLIPEKLERPEYCRYTSSPQEGDRIPITWTESPSTHVPGVSYELEKQIDGGAWERVYRGGSISYYFTVPKANTIHFRVKTVKTGYDDSDYIYGSVRDVKDPPLMKSTWTAYRVDSWRSRDDWGWRDDNNLLYQGAWNEPPWWGNHRGLAWFDISDIKKKIDGKKIEKVRLYFYRINKGGYYAGQSIKLWTHNEPTSVIANEIKPALSYLQGPMGSYARGDGKWLTVTNELAKRIQEGWVKGIALYREDELGYLYMSNNVKLEITYR